MKKNYKNSTSPALPTARAARQPQRECNCPRERGRAGSATALRRLLPACQPAASALAPPDSMALKSTGARTLLQACSPAFAPLLFNASLFAARFACWQRGSAKECGKRVRLLQPGMQRRRTWVQERLVVILSVSAGLCAPEYRSANGRA